MCRARVFDYSDLRSKIWGLGFQVLVSGGFGVQRVWGLGVSGPFWSSLDASKRGAASTQKAPVKALRV